eukprot:5298008-Amphidinium_carterae.1
MDVQAMICTGLGAGLASKVLQTRGSGELHRRLLRDADENDVDIAVTFLAGIYARELVASLRAH